MTADPYTVLDEWEAEQGPQLIIWADDASPEEAERIFNRVVDQAFVIADGTAIAAVATMTPSKADPDLTRAVAAIRAVLGLHKPQNDGPWSLVDWTFCTCGAMETHLDEQGLPYTGPATYPCPTVRALTDALTNGAHDGE